MTQQNKLQHSFRYHPEPLVSGAFVEGEAVCSCCNKPTEVYYIGPFYAVEEDLCFCPACIASGDAAEKFDGFFTAPDYCDDIGDAARLEEVCHRTPGYFGVQQESWLAHCGEYCAYISSVGNDDLTPQQWKEIEETWHDRLQRWELEQVRSSLGLRYEGYLFRCLRCHKHLLYVQRD